MIWFWLIGFFVVVFGFVAFLGAPYVPSQHRYLKQAFTDLHPIGTNDKLVDLGSGDGVVLRMATKQGARAVGYELNPILVLLSRLISARNTGIEIHLASYWSAEFPSDTTVVYAFTVSRDIKRMAQKIQSEATRLNRPIWFIVLGNKIPNMAVHSANEPYYCYVFYPLHKNKT